MGTHPIFESDFDCLTEVKMSLPRCYFDMSIGGQPAGRIVMELRSDVVRKTSVPFALAKRDLGLPTHHSTVLFPNSCAREEISLITTVPVLYQWPTLDLAQMVLSFSFAQSRLNGLMESMLFSEVWSKAWKLSRKLKALDPRVVKRLGQSKLRNVDNCKINQPNNDISSKFRSLFPDPSKLPN